MATWPAAGHFFSVWWLPVRASKPFMWKQNTLKWFQRYKKTLRPCQRQHIATHAENKPPYPNKLLICCSYFSTGLGWHTIKKMTFVSDRMDCDLVRNDIIQNLPIGFYFLCVQFEWNCTCMLYTDVWATWTSNSVCLWAQQRRHIQLLTRCAAPVSVMPTE